MFDFRSVSQVARNNQAFTLPDDLPLKHLAKTRVVVRPREDTQSIDEEHMRKVLGTFVVKQVPVDYGQFNAQIAETILRRLCYLVAVPFDFERVRTLDEKGVNEM